MHPLDAMPWKCSSWAHLAAKKQHRLIAKSSIDGPQNILWRIGPHFTMGHIMTAVAAEVASHLEACALPGCPWVPSAVR